LEGDTNTGFFHSVANGRRRKCIIEFLDTGRGRITEQRELVAHIEDFYKTLFGREERGSLRLGSSTWRDKGRLNSEQKETLVRTFTMEEAERVRKEMRTETTPGPDGFPVIFYKKFWGVIKWLVMQMLEDFYYGKLNLSRLNYRVIVLIPKIREVVNVKKFRPICLLNVFYKFFTKILASRLMEVVGDIISENQIAFIKGRNILEGVLILHEVVHELNGKKQSGIILKLDFEKTYDKVHWDFLEDVLILKDFPGRWIEWIKLVQGGGE
jgi:hypothetical protein